MLKIAYNHDFLKHSPPYAHPENPTRIKKALDALKRFGMGDLIEECTCDDDLWKVAALAHEKSYVEKIKALILSGEEWIDSDTYISPGTFASLSRALACTKCIAERALLSNSVEEFLLLRPPGHHAGASGPAMGAPTLGFCIFNNIAIAAKLLSLRGNVMIIDFDAHHGNGTQEIFYRDKKVYHVDIHQHPSTLYPGTGWPGETGEGEGKGTKLNIPLPPGSGDDIAEDVIEMLYKYAEMSSFDYLLVSAGFDAFAGDGLSGLHFSEISYYKLGELVISLAKGKPMLIFLEGGYSLGLERGLPAFLMGVLKKGEIGSWEAKKSGEKAWKLYSEYKKELKGYYPWL